jgi:alpha-L-arabinofuranosidase
VDSAIDKVAEVCRRVGIEQDHCVLEFEEQGAPSKLSPETWAQGVSYSLQQGYRFHHWEIANEPYASLWGGGGAFPTPEAFITHFEAVSDAIRRVDSHAQIGMDINVGNVRWGNYVLQQLAGEYDFVAPHYYCSANVHRLKFEDITLSENYRMLDRALRIQALLHAYNGDRPVYQYDTEWGMICGTTDGREADYEDRNANIIGTVHRAVRLIYYAREDIVRGASGWQMLSRLGGQGFGILSQEAPAQRFMLYWLYYYFNRHIGPWVLQMDGTAPFYEPQQGAEKFAGPLTPVLATLSEDENEIYLVMANGSWTRAVPCRLKLQGFRAAKARGIVISSNDLDGKPLLERTEDAVSDLKVDTTGEEVTCTLGPHAVAFVILSRS